MKHWIKAGSHPQNYEIGVSTLPDGKKCGLLKCTEPTSNIFGTLMQTFSATNYRSKRMLFSALVCSLDVDEWAGLWMRIDGPRTETLGFDNMKDRPIKGTTEWRRYNVVLDVPSEAREIAFGVLLSGNGVVEIRELRFEETGLEVTERKKEIPLEPGNLDFSEEFGNE